MIKAATYLLRSTKRVPVIKKRNATWRVKEKSLEEKANPNITARHTTSIKNAIFSVFQVGA